MFGRFKTYFWHMLGICLAYAWQVFGIFLAYLWHLLDIYMLSLSTPLLSVHLRTSQRGTPEWLSGRAPSLQTFMGVWAYNEHFSWLLMVFLFVCSETHIYFFFLLVSLSRLFLYRSKKRHFFDFCRLPPRPYIHKYLGGRQRPAYTLSGRRP